MPSPIHLEGTTLEGGGQLLRIALGISSLTKTPIHITNIRGKRSGGGGLKQQHLCSVRWLGTASHARLGGVGLKSKELHFTPSTKLDLENPLEYWHRDVPGGTSVLETQITQNTPGSIGLVFQAILPYLVFAGSGLSMDSANPHPIRVRITGGTNVSNSPSYDYIAQVLLPMLALIGLSNITAELHHRGWSQGKVAIGAASFTVTPLALNASLPGFILKERGDILQVHATIVAPKTWESSFRNQVDSVLTQQHTAIFGSGESKVTITFEDSKHEKRVYLLLVATTTHGLKLGRDWLYDKGVGNGGIDTAARRVVKQVLDELLVEIRHGGCVDEYMRDQLVIFQALAKGKSHVNGGSKENGDSVPASLHARTAQWVVGEILDVEFEKETSCTGVGFVAGEVFADRSARAAEEDGEIVMELERLEVSIFPL